jgi:hypothetical protein
LNGLEFGDDFGRNSKPGQTPGIRLLRKPEKIHHRSTSNYLTSAKASIKYRKIPANPSLASSQGGAFGFMSSRSSPQPLPPQPCKHPRVQIVSREEDAEFLECLECREVFEASELKDMSIEERTNGPQEIDEP